MAIAKKRKKFFDVNIPIIGKQTQLQAVDIKELEGRHIKYDLTRILRGKNILLQLRVKVDKEEATATPREIILLPYYLRRMIRKGTDYVEDSFSADCKDAQLRIKPFLITRKRVSKSIRRTLRERAKEELIKYIKSKEAEKIFDEVLKNKLQKDLSLKLKKTYPLALCEIRILKIEEQKAGLLDNSSKKQTKKPEVPEKEEEKKKE